MLQQEQLTRNRPPLLVLVFDEAVLLRRIGDPAVMHGQLERLVDVAGLPNVILRNVPSETTLAAADRSRTPGLPPGLRKCRGVSVAPNLPPNKF